jgi:hypothetical protein
MQCIQTNKNGKRCTYNCPHGDANQGYCNYHMNRFNQNKDIPTPFQEPIQFQVNNLVIPQPPLQPPPLLRIPGIQFVAEGFPLEINEVNIDNLFNMAIDNRINEFVETHRAQLEATVVGRNQIEQDIAIFDIVIGLTDQEYQNFLIANYERVVEIINQRVNQGIPLPQQDVIPMAQNQGGLINAILAALGLNNRVQNPQAQGAQGRRDDLAAFIQDKENVHTKEVVDPVVKTAKKLIKYSNKISKTQDTFKEIICNCDLTGESRKQMCLMYYSTDRIYNLKAPTYKLILDGLWGFILHQKEDNKKELTLRLSQELEDSIGTCPAGNISRLINVLTGYIEVSCKQEESIQDLMAKISKIEDKSKRMEEAKNVLKSKKIPEPEWNVWLEALEEV